MGFRTENGSYIGVHCLNSLRNVFDGDMWDMGFTPRESLAVERRQMNLCNRHRGQCVQAYCIAERIVRAADLRPLTPWLWTSHLGSGIARTLAEVVRVCGLHVGGSPEFFSPEVEYTPTRA
jgi:hypothetical protein